MRLAIGLRRIDPADIPLSAQTAPAPVPVNRTPSQTLSQSNQGATATQATNVAGPSQKKRKAQWEAQFGSASIRASSSKSAAVQAGPVASHSLRQLVVPTAAQIAEDEAQLAEAAEETGPDEPIEELLCSTKAKIVGIQYYKGISLSFRVCYVWGLITSA